MISGIEKRMSAESIGGEYSISVSFSRKSSGCNRTLAARLQQYLANGAQCHIWGFGE